VTSVVFWVLAPLAVASGVMVFRFNSMARATFALLISFLAAGGLLIWLGLFLRLLHLGLGCFRSIVVATLLRIHVRNGRQWLGRHLRLGCCRRSRLGAAGPGS